MPRGSDGLDIAVIGTGIAGMSAAWLLSMAHRVTVYEREPRIGGHTYTLEAPLHGAASGAGAMPVDFGFIVFNEATYPNLTALFRHLQVPTHASDMSFAVSLEDGGLEYAGNDLNGLFAQRGNLLRPRFWSMLRDLIRFYRTAPAHAAALAPDSPSLGAYLAQHGYRQPFIQDHLLPMAAAIWSTPRDDVADYPAASFIQFFENHGLLKLTNRPIWRTVTGGSRSYVARLTERYADRIKLGAGVQSVRRNEGEVRVRDSSGNEARFDHVVIAAHADEALGMLADPSPEEQALLGAVRYGVNDAVMHKDASLMPRRRNAWASWNYIGAKDGALCATYWMNKLQDLPDEHPVFVTLNPLRDPAPGSVFHRARFTHPRFDGAAMRAQRGLWLLQGKRRSWFCGAYFGAGFHEDGLQAGLAVAEALGGVRRPWNVAEESGRIHLGQVAR